MKGWRLLFEFQVTEYKVIGDDSTMSVMLLWRPAVIAANKKTRVWVFSATEN